MRFEPPRPRNDEERILPLVNVVLLLLIFFMLAGRLAASDPFEIAPPRSASPKPVRGCGGGRRIRRGRHRRRARQGARTAPSDRDGQGEGGFHLQLAGQPVGHAGDEAVAGADRALDLDVGAGQEPAAVVPDDDGALRAQGQGDDLGPAIVQHLPAQRLLLAAVGGLAAQQVLQLALVRLDHMNALLQGVEQRPAGGVQHHPHAPLLGPAGGIGIEAARHARRQAAGHHQPVGVDRVKRIDRRLLLLFTDVRAGRHDAIFLAGPPFVGHGGDTCLPGDRDCLPGQADLLQPLVEQVAGRSPGQIDRQRVAAQLLDHARDVDAAAAGIGAPARGPQLANGHHLVDFPGDIDAGVHGQGDNRLHGSGTGCWVKGGGGSRCKQQ